MGNEEAPVTDDDVSDTSPVRKRGDSRLEFTGKKNLSPDRNKVSSIEE